MVQPDCRRDRVSVSMPTNVPLPRSTLIGVDVTKRACNLSILDELDRLPTAVRLGFYNAGVEYREEACNCE